MSDYFGGPSSQQEAGAAQEGGLATSLNSNYQQQYGQQQSTLQQLNNEVGRIQSGNTGPGFGGAENAAYISDIQNQGAAAARNAIQASRTVGAGSQNAPTGGLTRESGIQQQVGGQIEAGAGINTANKLNQETAANYATGRQNAITTAQALQTMANSYNPLGYASGASSANSSAFNENSTINTENQQKSQAEVGLAEQVAGAAIGGVAGGMGNLDTTPGGSTGGEQLANFFHGAGGGVTGQGP